MRSLTGEDDGLSWRDSCLTAPPGEKRHRVHKFSVSRVDGTKLLRWDGSVIWRIPNCLLEEVMDESLDDRFWDGAS